MKNLSILSLVTLFFLGCQEKKDCPRLDKPVIAIEGINDLNSYLYNRIESIAYLEYYQNLSESKDSTDITKLNYSLKLMFITMSIDSLTENITKKIIAQTNLSTTIQDTISFKYLINNYSHTFSRELLKEKNLQANYKEIVNYQQEIQALKNEIIKSQSGKGCIHCRAIGEKLDTSNLNKSTDYWDLFYLIESTRYTLYREILCSYTNLNSYGKELRHKFTLKYDGKFPDFKDTTNKNNY